MQNEIANIALVSRAYNNGIFALFWFIIVIIFNFDARARQYQNTILCHYNEFLAYQKT